MRTFRGLAADSADPGRPSPTDDSIPMQDHGNAAREGAPMNLGIRTEHFGQSEPTVPRRYKIKATGETGTALGPSKAPTATHQQMNDGERHLHVVTLLMENTGEVRMYADDALETQD